MKIKFLKVSSERYLKRRPLLRESFVFFDQKLKEFVGYLGGDVEGERERDREDGKNSVRNHAYFHTHIEREREKV